MRKIAEIRKDLSAKIAEVKALENTAENAGAIQKGLDDIKALETELERALEVDAAERRLAEDHFEKEAKKGHVFSFTKFLRECSEIPNGGQLTGLEREAAEMGRDEHKSLGLKQFGHVVPSALLRTAAGQNYTTNADGGYLKETMPARYIDSLRARLVVANMGATLLGDLVGTLPTISSNDFTAGWLAEAAVGQVTKLTFAPGDLTPHRNFVAGAVTKDLLRQTSLDVEALIRKKLLDAHATLIDEAAITGTGSNNQPTGVLNTNGIGSVAMGTNGAALTWAKIVALETAINNNNANRGKLGYLANAKVWGELKSIERTANSGRFLLDEGGRLNGYKVDWTTLVPSNLTKGTGTGLSPLIFGNWEDLWIGSWGGIDLVVDPFVLATSAEIRIILNAWNDAKVVEPKSFAAIKDIVTA